MVIPGAGYKRSLAGLVFFAALGSGSPPAGGGDGTLIPQEDERWDSALRRGVDLIRGGDLKEGITILQDVVNDPRSRRGLKEVPRNFDPSILLSGESIDPSPPANDGEGPRTEEEEGGGRYYLPVQEIARQLLRGLPPEGMKIYRKLYDPAVEASYRTALGTLDLDLLRRVAEDHSPSSFGALARDRLAEALFERGDFWSALAHWKSIPEDPALSERTDSSETSVEIELKCLAALRLLGAADYGEARKTFLTRLRTQAGSDGLAGAEEGFLSWLEAFEASSPLPEGGRGMSCAPGLPSIPLPRLPSLELGLEWQSGFWSGGEMAVLRMAGPRSIEEVYPFFPVPAGGPGEGAIYINGIFQLQRLSQTTGRVLRPFYSKPILAKDLRYFEEKGDSPVFCVTLARGAAGALAGSSEGPRRGDIVLASFLSARVKPQSYRGYEITTEIPTRSIAAFESETGKLIWHTGGLILGPGRKPVSFTTPALVVGRRVFAGGWEQSGYVNGILVAMDLYDGRILWHQLLVSNQLELTMFGELGREPFASVLAEREGVIYCPTSLGAVAAVEAATGRILWITAYDAIDVEPGEGMKSPIREIVWGVNPPLLIGENLILTPRDSDYLYAIDIGFAGGRGPRWRQPGRILWSVANSGGPFRDLIGCAGGILYFTGPGGVQGLDIGHVPKGGSPRRLTSKISWGQRGISGRGALTESGVVVVAEAPGLREELEGSESFTGKRESRLWLVDLSLQKRTPLTGRLSSWGLLGAQVGENRYLPFSGNVTSLPGRILVTSRSTISSFCARVKQPQGPGTVPAPPGASLDAKPPSGKERP